MSRTMNYQCDLCQKETGQMELRRVTISWHTPVFACKDTEGEPESIDICSSCRKASRVEDATDIRKCLLAILRSGGMISIQLKEMEDGCNTEIY